VRFKHRLSRRCGHRRPHSWPWSRGLRCSARRRCPSHR
jgi:hypothetical protein